MKKIIYEVTYRNKSDQDGTMRLWSNRDSLDQADRDLRYLSSRLCVSEAQITKMTPEVLKRWPEPDLGSE